MSLMNARMAIKNVLLGSLRGSCFVAGLGAAASCEAVYSQENFFRLSSVQVPAIITVPSPRLQQVAAKKGDEAKAGQASEEVIRDKPVQSQAKDTAGDSLSETTSNKEQPAKNREPLVLPALSMPNTSIVGVGTGATPQDQVAGRLPATISLPYGSDRYGFWALESKTWTAPVFCHQPVYFEDTMLERHGHERLPCLQPVLSGTRFFTDIAFLPYNAYLQRPLEERYDTGHYRQGSAVPALRQRSPYDAGAMRFQLLTTGTAVLAVQP